MSLENVEIVRSIYDAVARRDDVTPFEVYAEDIVWDLSKARRAALNPQPVYHGHEGVRQGWRDVLSVFGAVDFEVEELIDAGDRVLAVIREREIGRASGVPVETTLTVTLSIVLHGLSARPGANAYVKAIERLRRIRPRAPELSEA